MAERGEGFWDVEVAAPGLQLRLIGQLQSTVLLAEGRGGLYVVDQHRAHERIIYELLTARHAPPGAAQYLLEPVVLELSPARAELLGDRLEALDALGFTCERFGPHSFLVRSTRNLLRRRPAGHARTDAGGSLGRAPGLARAPVDPGRPAARRSGEADS